MTGLVGGGAMGCLLGLYGLLWVQGPRADYLNLARYLPQAMLPPSVRSQEATEGKTKKETEASNLDVSQAKVPAIRRDDFVQLATATEPVRPTPPPQPLTAEISAAEFVQLLAAAEKAHPALVDGDFDDPKIKKVKGLAYIVMCRLAEKIDAVDDSNSAGDTEQAAALFRRTLVRGLFADDLGEIASYWWQHPERPTQGVFFVGQVQSVQTLGGQTYCQIATGDGRATSTLPVLLREGSLSQGQYIGIVGVIVTDPKQHLAEFKGDEAQIIVATRIFPLDRPANDE